MYRPIDTIGVIIQSLHQKRDMRPRVDWIKRVDDFILELLSSSGLDLTPGVIAHNLEYNRKYVNRRCSKLARAELVEKVSDVSGFYRISEKGRAYLRGDLTADELPDPDV